MRLKCHVNSRLFVLLLFFLEVAIISKEARVNEGIRAKEVRVIYNKGEQPDIKGEQPDIIPIRDAIQIARERGFDLVEIDPNAKPPVCKIMDYGKFKFDQSKKDKEAKKKQKIIQVKEMKLRLGIEDHDFRVKAKNIQKFLEEGHKVKVTIMFRGREINHPEIGKILCDKLVEFLNKYAIIDKMAKHDGRNMIMILAPKNV